MHEQMLQGMTDYFHKVRKIYRRQLDERFAMFLQAYSGAHGARGTAAHSNSALLQ